MAVAATNPLYNIDYSKYNTWPKVVSKIDGKTYYQVPGQEGAYFDPLSGRNGRVSRLPEQQIEDKKKVDSALNPQPGAGEQIAGAFAPIAGAAGGILLANKIGDWTDPATKATETITQQGANQATQTAGRELANQAAQQTGQQLGQQAGTQIGQQAAQQGSNLGLLGTGQPAVQTTQTVQEVGTAANGGKLLSNGQIANPDGSVTDPNTGAPQGSWVQGAAGAIQVISGIQQWKEGDKIGGGLGISSGTSNIIASSPSIFGEQAAGQAAGVNQVLGPIAGAYGAYQTAKMTGSMPAGGRRNTNAALGGAASGAAVGSAFGPIGTGVGALVGATVGALGSVFGSSKDKYQMMRDEARKVWQKNGLIDENFQGTLADGTKFDFGKDGKKYGKLNTEDPNWQKIAALSNVIAAGEGASGKAGEAIATLYTNAALSNSGGDYNKALANIKHFANQRGFNVDNVQGQLDKLHQEKQITDDQYKVWSADKNVIFGPAGNNPNTGKTAVAKPQERVSGKNLGILNTQSAKPEPQITKKEEEKSLGILGKRIKRK